MKIELIHYETIIISTSKPCYAYHYMMLNPYGESAPQGATTIPYVNLFTI